MCFEKARRTGHLRILIADDHPLTQMGLQQMLLGSPWPFCVELQIKMASRCAEVCEYITNWEVDLLLLDDTLPDTAELCPLENLHQYSPGARVLILCHHESSLQGGSLQRLQALGVQGMISKNAPIDTVFNAVQAIGYGGYYLPDTLTVDSDTSLSLREQQILRLLAKDHDKHEIALKLDLSSRTIEAYRSRLMKKLNVRTLSGLVRSAYQHRVLEFSPRAVGNQ